jgi:hypothetical protein
MEDIFFIPSLRASRNLQKKKKKKTQHKDLILFFFPASITFRWVLSIA